MCQCLEFQFDAVISDRRMILHCMHLLANLLPDLDILNWDFFLARFDSLSLEAQLDLESTGDLSCPTGTHSFVFIASLSFLISVTNSPILVKA